ncbi:fungal-specific transcription factor domain-containing protein [Xylariomycetidae sp. FL0641]|nr:fungal-specific transcription factor domain-containing protein [Xylariomycetidae sp. FL0641]
MKRLRAQVREFKDNNNNNNNNSSSASASSSAPDDQQQRQQTPQNRLEETEQRQSPREQQDPQPDPQGQEQQEQQEHQEHHQRYQQHQQQQPQQQHEYEQRQQLEQHDQPHREERHQLPKHDDQGQLELREQQEGGPSQTNTPGSASSESSGGVPNSTKAPSTSATSPANTSETSLYPSRSSPAPDRPWLPAASRSGVRVDSIPYGVTSLTFFLTRMDHFLQSVRQRAPLDMDLDKSPTNAHTGAGRATSSRPVPELHPQYPHQPVSTVTSTSYNYGYLTRAQESLFLDMFWQTHYFSFPVLNEGEFRSLFKTLWNQSPPGGPREASPLVDIVIALCVQLVGFIIRHDEPASAGGAGDGGHHQQDRPPTDDAGSPSLGGFQYYQRCQGAIDNLMDSPSIENVQCYIFSIVYLYEAGLLNRAQVVAGKAIMMAMILGLPNEPPPDLPEPQREVLRRTWWSLYIIDTKLSMETGRPPVINPSHSTCRLPSDSNEVAKWLGPHYSFDDSCPTWLGFQTQTLRLLDAVRSVRSVFHAKYDAVVGSNGYQDFVNNASAREECACLLTEQMKELSAWTKQVPGGHRVARRDGRSFSTDRNPLEFEVDMIIHCQRQRLLLELQYHQYCMSLYQSFICFNPAPDEEPTPVSDAKAAAALAHAMTLTSMIHQTLTNTEALSGVYHVFRWQKNALFTMLGFAYTFPLRGAAPSTRKSIEMAIAVVDMYRDILPEAKSVAAVARALAEDVTTMISSRFGAITRDSLSSPSSLTSSMAAVMGTATATANQTSPTAGTSRAASVTSSSEKRPAPPQPSDPTVTFTADPVPGQPDWNMMAMPPFSATANAPSSAAGPMLNLDFLQELNHDDANVDAMNTLWASMDPGGDATTSNLDSWPSMGDPSLMGGMNFDEMDYSL